MMYRGAPVMNTMVTDWKSRQPIPSESKHVSDWKNSRQIHLVLPFLKSNAMQCIYVLRKCVRISNGSIKCTLYYYVVIISIFVYHLVQITHAK